MNRLLAGNSNSEGISELVKYYRACEIFQSLWNIYELMKYL